MTLQVDNKAKRLFLHLATISQIMIVAAGLTIWWLVFPRLNTVSPILHWAFGVLVILFVGFTLVGWGVVLWLSHSHVCPKRFRPSVAFFLRIIYPLAQIVRRGLNLSQDQVRESFIEMNNAFANGVKRRFMASEILVLLPHCLQEISCNKRVTHEILNCTECGCCSIGRLKRLSIELGVYFSVATGGTLARRLIIERKPKFIIAVACHRDLVEGVRDVFPIPVYAVLNERPNGPCINTEVDVDKLEEILKQVIRKEEYIN